MWTMPLNSFYSQVHNTFAILGTRHGDSYDIHSDCLATLEDILRKLSIEDQTLRTFRRAIGFGQNIRKDLIPLLIYAKSDPKVADVTQIVNTTVKILVNLTVPVECLLPIDAVSRTDVGRHTIFELDRLLTTSKEAFTDWRLTKAVMDHMKSVLEQDGNLTVQQCDSINNCLLLLRNILHIPDCKDKGSVDDVAGSNTSRICTSGTTGSNINIAIGKNTSTFTSLQNEIIWNLFTQSIDKMMIYLISCPQKSFWSVTSVQLISLLYKDQHVGTLQKLLNLCLETTPSESTEDNESNTSPPNRGSGDSSPIITSDPTSDSSDNGGKSNDYSSSTSALKEKTTQIMRAVQNRSNVLAGMKRVHSTETENSSSSGVSSMVQSSTETASLNSKPDLILKSPIEQMSPKESDLNRVPSSTSCNLLEEPMSCNPAKLATTETSDCGYATQVENQESISTSSNDDDLPQKKPVHQKPHSFQKMRYNNTKNRTATTLEKRELRRKKLVRRSKTNMINMKGLMHHMPTDEDIANILKEFTVDFLLKGYGTLVQDLYSQMLGNINVPIDTSHFFWLVTYFLKFATQLELDLEHVSGVLSYDIICYLLFQGVGLYEDLEVNRNIPGVDLKPCLRRLHLVVTAISEFLQAVQSYRKLTHLSQEDRNIITHLERQLLQTDSLKSIFLLLLRQYNPHLQSRQYLQDLIVTNHNYLLFVDSNANLLSLKDGSRSAQMVEHLKEFATLDIMRQYGLLLEDFKSNGEYVNNCVFTMMHHISGDLDNVSTLFQPSILKTFSQIWETDYEICDDWSDLIEFVIHKFINTPRTNHCSSVSTPSPVMVQVEHMTSPALSSRSSKNNWSQEDKEHLQTFYNDSRSSVDKLSEICKSFVELDPKFSRSEQCVLKELLQQNIITQLEYEELARTAKQEDGLTPNNEETCNTRHGPFMFFNGTESDTVINGDIKVLKEYLYKENKGRLILWLQNVLIEACSAKLFLRNPDVFQSSLFIIEPVVYYYALLHLPIPIVPWTFEQTNILKHQPFILLMHKLGFHFPTDTGKIFARIPSFWTPDHLFHIAQQLGPIDSNKLKFDVSLLVSESTDNVNKRWIEFKGINDNISKLNRYKLPRDFYKPSTSGIPSHTQLSIKIPKMEFLPILSPPQLLITYPQFSPDISQKSMDISPTSLPVEEDSNFLETASVASDLTRMCVSDEDEKLIYPVDS